MKRAVFAACLSLSFFVVGVCGQQTSEGPLTNESVVKLVKAGFKEKTVIAIIHNRPSVFKLEPEQLIQLKRQGVSENIILAMLATQDATFTISDDEWVSDEAFFNRGKKPANGAEQNSGTSIFGSGGGSQSRSESRAGNGGNVSDGVVTGSASVRIIKPESESGSAATPKLEKTPVLDNDGVIRLVQAGFSEGTIIKRIEESPVNFDLSPGKLDELYKKRVTDQIIAAMAAAMGKDR
ncbi:MAG TPA: hypothetical protein VFT08_03840 [Pyrinomonadaceae bacterium]|nr:hypothetical protein [Pyrinomonadaceae bacterium]